MAHENGGALTLMNSLVARMEALAAMQAEAMGAQRLPGSGLFAFRKMTEPLMLEVGPSVTKFDVPAGFFDANGPGFQATSWFVVNPNECWVRLRGTTSGSYVPVAANTGWAFPPGFAGVFSTQKPIFMSTLAVAKPGRPLPSEYAPLELIYGGGT